MCGICGIYKFDKNEILKNELKVMNDTMIFRGPDDDGYFVNNNFGFAMRNYQSLIFKTVSSQYMTRHLIIALF